jgi:penicillin-binding protein 2
MYPEAGDTTIISNSIGQGEVLMTPIQLASMMATVANYYYTPHIIKKIKAAIDPKFKESIKRQSTKVFQTDDQRPDVYNLGTASTLG